MTRTDIHRPSAIDPSSYAYFDSFDNGLPLPMTRRDGSPNPAAVHRDKLREVARKGSPHDSPTRCAHCGAHLRYVAVMIHEPTRTFVPWGFDCLDTLSALDSAAAAARRRMEIAAAAARQAERNQQAREAFAAEEPELFAFMTDALANPADHLSFVVDVSRRWDAEPERGLSERQLAAMRKMMAKRAEYLARQAEREAERTAEQAARKPLPEDLLEQRVTVTGTIRKVDAKEYDDGYGGVRTRFVMTVADDRGFIVWGTAPNAIMHQLDEDEDVEVRVQFDCRIERPRNGSGMVDGFFTRPSKAKVLGVEVPTAHTCPSCGAEHADKTELYLDGGTVRCTTCAPLGF